VSGPASSLRLGGRGSRVALAVVASYLAVALFVALGLGGDPDARVGAKLLGPGADHWLGTDRQGRDIFVRTLVAAKVSVGVGLPSALIATTIGVVLGALAGWFRGAIDAIVVWLFSTVQAIPTVLLLVAIAWVAGRGLGALHVAFVATLWIAPCRLVRGEVLKLRAAPWVEAARGLGYGDLRILVRHVLPNLAHVVVASFVATFVSAVKSEVILSYLGLGAVGVPSWGVMIHQATTELATGFLWQLGAASVAVSGLVLALTVLTSALQDSPAAPAGVRQL
jgi:ABC-type dipeptide/oligopeptide/nickel transport system permease subunit